MLFGGKTWELAAVKDTHEFNAWSSAVNTCNTWSTSKSGNADCASAIPSGFTSVLWTFASDHSQWIRYDHGDNTPFDNYLTGTSGDNIENVDMTMAGAGRKTVSRLHFYSNHYISQDHGYSDEKTLELWTGESDCTDQTADDSSACGTKCIEGKCLQNVAIQVWYTTE